MKAGTLPGQSDVIASIRLKLSKATEPQSPYDPWSYHLVYRGLSEHIKRIRLFPRRYTRKAASDLEQAHMYMRSAQRYWVTTHKLNELVGGTCKVPGAEDRQLAADMLVTRPIWLEFPQMIPIEVNNVIRYEFCAASIHREGAEVVSMSYPVSTANSESSKEGWGSMADYWPWIERFQESSVTERTLIAARVKNLVTWIVSKMGQVPVCVRGSAQESGEVVENVKGNPPAIMTVTRLPKDALLLTIPSPRLLYRKSKGQTGNSREPYSPCVVRSHIRSYHRCRYCHYRFKAPDAYEHKPCAKCNRQPTNADDFAIKRICIHEHKRGKGDPAPVDKSFIVT